MSVLPKVGHSSLIDKINKQAGMLVLPKVGQSFLIDKINNKQTRMSVLLDEILINY